jgi:hypothetical protein
MVLDSFRDPDQRARHGPVTVGGLAETAAACRRSGCWRWSRCRVDFAYVWFGLMVFVIGFAMGLFAAPNQTGIINSLPPDQRGAGAGIGYTRWARRGRRSSTSCRTRRPST